MHERLGARAWRIKWEPEASQLAGGRPLRRVPAISQGKVLGNPREEHVPTLIAGRFWRIREQSLTRFRRLPLVLLQELDDQPPSRVEVRLGRNKASKLSEAHRLVIHKGQSSERGPPRSRPGRALDSARLLFRRCTEWVTSAVMPGTLTTVHRWNNRG